MNYKGERRFDSHFLDRETFLAVGEYDIPVLFPEQWVENVEFVSFNYARTTTDRKNKGVHFFIDDYQFDRLWVNWGKYSKMLVEFGAVMTPDFSTFRNWSKAAQIWNHYRKHYIGAQMQTMGLRVYPTISWSDEKSFDWCFDGEPAGGTVAVSSIGTQRDSECKRYFMLGYDAMLERLNPETVIFYGPVPEECRGNIVRIKAFQEKFHEVKTGW